MGIFDRIRDHFVDEETNEKGFESPSPEEALAENSAADELSTT